MNFLVETKSEYTTQLINIITPFLYEGFQTIYDEALKISKSNDELKTFQTFLRRIPSWTTTIIQNESKRILIESEYRDILDDLLKAVIKSNIMLLTNTAPNKKNKLKIKFVIEFEKFIHCAYIESARSIFQNPYLFFHKYSQLELKRNQRESHEVIKTSVMEAIRKMLPINLILKEYLGESYTDNIPTSDTSESIEQTISAADHQRVKQLLKTEFNDNGVSYQLQQKSQEPPQFPNRFNQRPEINTDISEFTIQGTDKQQGGKIHSEEKSEKHEKQHNKTTHSEEQHSHQHEKKKIHSEEHIKQPTKTHMDASESYLPFDNLNTNVYESYTMGTKQQFDKMPIKQQGSIKKKLISNEINI